MRKIRLIVHNVRSAHNVGSLLRSADGFGVDKVYLTGYSPYPELTGDERPPHIRKRVSAAIAKTALGAEKTVAWAHMQNIESCLVELEADDFTLVALEQTAQAADISSFKPNANIALIVGSEVGGLDETILKLAKVHLYIPMRGAKESFNVAVAAAVALYQLSSLDKHTT